MFYVLYSPSKKQYLDTVGDYCNFANAERFTQPTAVDLEIAQEFNKVSDLRWVGPCQEGEKP